MKECVRSLVLATTLFEFPIFDEEETESVDESGLRNSGDRISPRSLWGRFKQALMGSHQSNKYRPQDIVHYLNRFIKTLNHVTELTIDSHFNHALVPQSACSLALLGAAWETFGSTLRRLTLKGDLSLLEIVLQDSIHLESLEYLSVEIGRNRYGGDLSSTSSVLAHFIARHSPTLKTLEIFSNEIINLDLLTHGIGNLPHLRQLKFRQPPSNEPCHDSAIQKFLIRHKETITTFEWGYINPLVSWNIPPQPHDATIHSSKAPFNLAFPNLDQFAVGGTCPEPIYLRSAISFLERHQKNLTKLSFASWMLSPDEFATLVQTTTLPALKELDIGVEVLTSGVFTTLASKFPLLEVLGIAYDKTGRQLATSTTPDSTIPINAAEFGDRTRLVYGFAEFREDMEGLVLLDWPVQMLNIRRCACSEWQNHRAENVGKVVVAKLPRVGFVNGVYRESFLAVQPGRNFGFVSYSTPARR